jgi:predicted anti-sigma-YlaC factor YlaD
VTCAQIRNVLGVYVVGAIDSANRSLVDHHVAYCPGCRDDLATLAGLPALLGRVTEDQITELAESSPDEPFEAVLAEVVKQRRTERWHRRWHWGRLALAALAPAAAVAVIVGFALRPDAPPAAAPNPSTTTLVSVPPQTTLQAHDTVTGVDAKIGMTRKKWGTALTAELAGVPVGTTCKLVAVSKTGRQNDAASWRAAYSGWSMFAGSSMLSPEEILQFEVRSMDDKRTFVTIPVQ